MSISVLIADDHGAIRAGLALIINNAEGMQVVGEAADGHTAIRQARALRPDVTLMDVRMPGMDGIAATAELVAEQLTEVLVLTTFDLDEYVFAALKAGAVGFLLKSVEANRLVEAIRSVAAGDGVLAPQVTRRLIATFANHNRDMGAANDPPGLAELTDREKEVFALLGEGLANSGIARRLFIGETTVKTHVSRILAKLNLRSRVQAAILAKETGLANPKPNMDPPRPGLS